MPAPKLWLAIPHRKQAADGDCLAACVAMVLAHLGREASYAKVLRLLKIKPHGAPSRNVLLLENDPSLGINVTYSTTDMAGLDSLLRQGMPVIAFVSTHDLPYWTYATDHAVVVAGVDDMQIYLFDPDRNAEESPVVVTRGDFELAWLERDYAFAVLTLRGN